MSKIHYFQRYSQKENVATNNTLLLFSRLYNESTYKFNEFLNELLEEESLDIGVNFTQQEKSVNSIPDGTLSQSSFKISIETKLGSGKNFEKNQLINHLESFKNEDKKILVALSPTVMKDDIFKEVKIISKDQGIIFLNKTFKDIVKCFKEVITPYDFQLQEIIEDYEDYCIQESLVKDTDSRIRIIPCGSSIELNVKYGVYYMPADRGTSEHNYLGIYKDKAVRGVGKIINEVIANLVDGELVILKCKKKVTEDQKKRILDIAKETYENIGWSLGRCDHKYVIVDKFYETEYRKTSKGGIQGHRYQNLKDILKIDKLPNGQEIAELLKKQTWE